MLFSEACFSLTSSTRARSSQGRATTATFFWLEASLVIFEIMFAVVTGSTGASGLAASRTSARVTRLWTTFSLEGSSRGTSTASTSFFSRSCFNSWRIAPVTLPSLTLKPTIFAILHSLRNGGLAPFVTIIAPDHTDHELPMGLGPSFLTSAVTSFMVAANLGTSEAATHRSHTRSLSRPSVSRMVFMTTILRLSL